MIRCVLLTSAQAVSVRGPTADGAALEPRLVAAGTHAGKYVLGVRVLADPAHAAKHETLKALPQAELDPATAWPST